ncbi:MAG: dihydroorotate dehydrogenase [Treponemataceae bacterium]|nr:dihydroorotate dehydrogenase [Treponemataceae bacterium]
MTDCNGLPYPVKAIAAVKSCSEVEGAFPKGSVFLLKTILEKDSQKPLPGQFYMLHSLESKTLLSRPISVYSCNDDGVEFMILLKGQGTKELCSLEAGDKLELLGPLGNTFKKPEELGLNSSAKIAIIGGGIGIAPVAGFASTLDDQSYDFYASFKSGSYGLDKIKARKLLVTSDDGSVGIHGMLSAAFTLEAIKNEGYSLVYACGPTPMLSYVQKVCAQAGVKCYLSMESKMACGLGACLGCTIPTIEGNRRCCKDGPVFEGEKLIFPEMNPCPRKSPVEKPNLGVMIAGVHFNNPVIAASGTFGFGQEYASVFDVNRLGGICSKGLTLESKEGNSGIRLWETPSGLINSIGLENPGIEAFIKDKLPQMLKLKPVSIANLSGHSIEGYVEGAKLLDQTQIEMIELNISCPNVKKGGMGFGLEPSMAREVTRAVRQATKKPLIVKLSPNAPSIKDVALAVIEAGANAISLCNTFQAMAIDVEKEKFVFDNVTAGLAGPAVKPLALRIVYDVCKAINDLPKELQVPVIGLGGISCWQDAVEFILAGASAIQVGTATFANPECMIEIIEGIEKWMSRKGYKSIPEFRGKMLEK